MRLLASGHFGSKRRTAKKKEEIAMNNNVEKIGCADIAKAIQGIMTMANLSGFISQNDNGKLRQFSVEDIKGTHENATILLDFAEQSFKLDISLNQNK